MYSDGTDFETFQGKLESYLKTFEEREGSFFGNRRHRSPYPQDF